MKYFVLTLFFCAFVATAFSLPVAQDEAQDIANKFTDAIQKLHKAVKGLRADNQNEVADKVENLIPILEVYTNRQTVASNIKLAKATLESVEFLLLVIRKYWENSSLSATSVAELNKAISELFTSSEAQELVAKFIDAIPKLEKAEDGLRADRKHATADQLKRELPTIRFFYTKVEFIEHNLATAKQFWESVKSLLNATKKYWN